MKKVIILTMLCFSTFSFAQSPDEKELKNIVENLFEVVFSELDSTKINTYLTDDFLLFEDGEIWNNDTIRNMVTELTNQFNSDENKNHSFKRINSFKFIKSESDGKMATIYYENFADFQMDGTTIAKMHWLESATFRKTKDGWKMIFLHSSPVKEKNEN